MVEVLINFLRDNDYKFDIAKFYKKNIEIPKEHESIYQKREEVHDENDEFYNVLFINDKVIFLVDFMSIEELSDYILTIPSIREKIKAQINMEKNTSVKLYNTTISGFLWDIYIVGIYNKYPLGELKDFEVNEIEKDKFIGKKIIIQYDDTYELFEKFVKCIYPNCYLDNLVNENKYYTSSIDFTKINDNSDYLKYMSIILKKDINKASIEDIVDYIKKIDNLSLKR